MATLAKPVASPRQRLTRLATALPLIALGLAATARGETLEVAVVVNPEREVTDLSRSELERIFRLRRQRWADGQRIYLLMREEGSSEKSIVLDRIYRMSGDELKRFWLAKIYRGELASFPKTLGSGQAVISFVARAKNAIGFVDAREVDDSVRVVRIEGRLPGSDGYLLRGRPRPPD